jgi:large subunit ribosomal protein L24
MHIKVGDTVMVMAGADRGTQGRVLTVNHKVGKVVVEHVNRVFKHMRKSQRNQQGGRLSKEMPVQLSNVMLLCGSCGKPSRMGTRVKNDGSKERFCKKCSAGMGELAPSPEKLARNKS